jgi:hypothetical protein
MKRLITFLLLIFLGLGFSWGKEYRYSYDNMLEVKETRKVCRYAVPDEKLYDFTVYVWKNYFTDFYNKYGIPFIACYDDSEQRFEEGTAYHKAVYSSDDTYDFSIISVVDKTHTDRFNASDYFHEILDDNKYEDEYCLTIICHELCHLVEALEWPKSKIKMYPSHYNSVFLREANRILDEYDLDVEPY